MASSSDPRVDGIKFQKRESAWTFDGRLMNGGGRRETGVSRASTTGAHGIDFSYRFGAAA
jgi:hypothetical protein